MWRRRVVRWLGLLLLVPMLAQAADVQASLDRSSVRLGETVTLNLKLAQAGAGVAMPDLHALDKDFSILGTSQNSSMSIVNGAASSTLTIGVALRPRHAGTLSIPAIAVAGTQTQPLTLQVEEAQPDAAASNNSQIFMESEIEPARGYVGQQFSYVVRLYIATRLGSGELSTPQLDGVEVGQLGKDLNYDAERGGREYQVIERRYALTPQRAGHLEIPAVRFQGSAIDPNDPNSFFGSAMAVSASAPSRSIDVQPAPTDWGKSAWLPARQLSLSLDGWPDPQHPVRAGQPLNLTMNLQATGLPFESLPALSLPALDGARVYPDKPVTGTRQDGLWLVGRRQQSFAIVPEHAGTLTIPATTLKWWNVLSGRAEVAEIPAHSLTVLPAVGAANPSSTRSTAPVAVSDHGTSAGSASGKAIPWRWLALGSLGLWVASAVAWWLWHRRRGNTAEDSAVDAPQTSGRRRQLEFLAAARGSDVALQARTLLAWARAQRPQIQHLGDLSAALHDPAQRAAIAALQQRQYAGEAAAVAVPDLAQAFKGGLAWRKDEVDADSSGLPPLYPFKLR